MSHLSAFRALSAILSILVLGGCDQQPRPAKRGDGVQAPAPSGDVAHPTRPTTGPAPRPEPLPAELIEVLRLNGRGSIEEARELARDYVREHPHDGRGHLMIGMTHHKAGNCEPAVAEFRRALELSPEYYLTHRYLGECLLLLGDLSGARLQYAALVSADPQEPAGHYGLGVVAIEEARLTAASDHLRRAIELFAQMSRASPRRFQARRSELAQCHARLADVHFARDEYLAARDELLAATTIEPRNISAFYALSLVYRRLDQDEKANEALKRYEDAKALILRDAAGAEE